MNGSGSPKRIAIFSPIGTGNLGDEATIAAVIQNIKRRHPEAQIYALCVHPHDTQTRHKVHALPMHPLGGRTSLGDGEKHAIIPQHRVKTFDHLAFIILKALKNVRPLYIPLRSIRDSCNFFHAVINEVISMAKAVKILEGLDLLIVAGSGQLSDHFGGAFNFPYALFKWSIIARMIRAKLVFLSVGAGPIDSPLSRFFIKRSLAAASYRSFRDAASKNLVEEMGIIGENLIFPDLAHSLEVNPSPSIPHHRKFQAIIGINPFPYYDHRYWPISDRHKYQSYLKTLSQFVEWLVDNNYKILFFPTQIHADLRVIQDLKNILKENIVMDLNEYIIEKSISTVDELISALSIVDLVVATRFHGILLSFLLNRPVMALSNHHKMSELMIDMGQNDYLLNIDSLDLQCLIEKFKMMESRKDLIKYQIQNKISQYRRSLEIQYACIIG